MESDPSASFIDYGSTHPCILRAWNNYHGYVKYKTIASDHQNKLDYFYTLTPPHHRTLAFSSSYFHIAVLYKWLELIECKSLFVVNGKHIYCVKQKGTGWQRYDWPFRDTYDSLWHLNNSFQHTLFVILLYPAENHERLIQAVQAWMPKRTAYYTEFRRKLLEGLRAASSIQDIRAE
jgi:hypothetical protein